MIRKSLGVFAAAGLLAVAVAGPVSAQAPEDPSASSRSPPVSPSSSPAGASCLVPTHRLARTGSTP